MKPFIFVVAFIVFGVAQASDLFNGRLDCQGIEIDITNRNTEVVAFWKLTSESGSTSVVYKIGEGPDYTSAEEPTGAVYFENSRTTLRIPNFVGSGQNVALNLIPLDYAEPAVDKPDYLGKGTLQFNDTTYGVQCDVFEQK